MNYNITPLAPSCPWYHLHKMAPTNVDWCEASVCGWINEPANTWSNLAYLVLTIWAYQMTKDKKGSPLKAFAPAFFFMGFFSFVYHASYNFFSQWLDFVGMFLMTGLFISLNFFRLGILKRANIFKFYGWFNVIFGIIVIIFYLTYVPIQSLILIHALFLVGSELKLRNSPNRKPYRPFIIAVLLIIVAAVFSVLDVTRTWCNPHNHFIQGHALWHLISAVSLGFAFKFYSQFDYDDA